MRLNPLRAVSHMAVLAFEPAYAHIFTGHGCGDNQSLLGITDDAVGGCWDWATEL